MTKMDQHSSQVWLVRHGETPWNRARRFLGSTDIGLSETGFAQASELAERVRGRVGKVYSSPLRRALETAGALTADVSVVHDLREMHQGVLEGLQFEEARAQYPEMIRRWNEHPDIALMPGGESLMDVQARSLAAVRDIAFRHRQDSKPVLVVAHQLVIASACCALADAPLQSWRTYRVGNTEGVRIWCSNSGGLSMGTLRDDFSSGREGQIV